MGSFVYPDSKIYDRVLVVYPSPKETHGIVDYLLMEPGIQPRHSSERSGTFLKEDERNICFFF